MTVYVHLPQVPLTLAFEEPVEEVAAHLQRLVEQARARCYEIAPGRLVVVNFRTLSVITLNDGHRTLEVSELHRAVPARIVTDEDSARSVEDA